MYYHLQFKETWDILAKEQSIYDVKIGFVFFCKYYTLSSSVSSGEQDNRKKKKNNKKPHNKLPAARV